MVYGIIGRIVVWAARRFLRRPYGKRAQKIGAGAIVAGALAALVLGGRGRGE